jgi:hypothetical protein
MAQQITWRISEHGADGRFGRVGELDLFLIIGPNERGTFLLGTTDAFDAAIGPRSPHGLLYEMDQTPLPLSLEDAQAQAEHRLAVLIRRMGLPAD